MRPLWNQLLQLPKVVLHDHLDGAMRVETLIELAARTGHHLPSTDPAELTAWFVQAASSGSLELYMKPYVHTLAVMQTRQALIRAAEEYALDLAAENVVYAETRYAPELHTRLGLSLADVIAAVQEGLAAGSAKAAVAGSPIQVKTLLCGMRDGIHSREIAELAVRFRDSGVVGFDIAGPENGYPPSDHLRAFEHAHRHGLPVTIHAGEAFGLPSIQQAVHACRAQRIGHGTRIIDDIKGADLGDPTRTELGPLASWIRENRIPLELCPTSNLQTGAAASIAEHPITALLDLGFRVTLNTDSRLIAGTSMTREMSLLVDDAGWTLDRLRMVTINAIESAFVSDDERNLILNEMIIPGYAKAEQQ